MIFLSQLPEVAETAEACLHHGQLRTVLASAVLVLCHGIAVLITPTLYLFTKAGLAGC